MNKKGIIMILAVIAALILGFGSAWAIYGTKKCEETKCQSDKSIEEKNNETEEKTEENIKEFINYTNENFMTDENLVGIILGENLTDSYKIAYSLQQETNLNYKDTSSEDESLLSAELELSKDELEQIVLKNFTKVSIENNKNYKGYLKNHFYNITCENDNCIIKHEQYSIGGTGYYDTYKTKIIKLENNQYLVKYYYVDYSENCNNPDENLCDITIFDRIKSNNKLEIQNVLREESNFENLEELNQLKCGISILSFDTDGRYINTEIIR